MAQISNNEALARELQQNFNNDWLMNGPDPTVDPISEVDEISNVYFNIDMGKKKEESLKQEQERKENQIISNGEIARRLQQEYKEEKYQQGHEEENYQGTSTIIEYLNKHNGKLEMEGQSIFTKEFGQTHSSICTFASAFMALDIILNSQIPLNNKEDIRNYTRMIYGTAQSIFKRENIQRNTSAEEFFNAKDIFSVEDIYEKGNNVIIHKIVGGKFGAGESQAWIFKDGGFYKIDTHCGGETGIQKSDHNKLFSVEGKSWGYKTVEGISLSISEIKEIKKYYKGYEEEKKRGGGKKLKKLKKILKKTKKLKKLKKILKKTKKTKKVRKHKGITQIGGNKGKLRKGYKYTGKRLKNGMAEIKKVKSKK